MRDNNQKLGAAGLSPTAFSGIRRDWLVVGAAVSLCAAALAIISPLFGHDADVVAMPILELVTLLVLTGAAFAIWVPMLVEKSAGVSPQQERTLTAIIVAAGLVARLLLLISEPILENDYYRYLWDGAVSAHGHNPYSVSPLSAIKQEPSGELGPLAVQSGKTLERIGHKELTTIYPPVAQAAFAVAHLIQPWNLGAWRLVLLISDITTLLLLLSLLRAIGRSELWSAVYWLNPIVLKEIFNSAHMEAIVLPLVLVAILLSIRRPLISTLALGLAAGAKLWPVLLAPLLLRSLLGNRTLLAISIVILGALMALWLAPLVTTGPGESAGLAAYVEHWRTNSALFPALEGVVTAAMARKGPEGINAALLTKALLGLALVALAMTQALRPLGGLEDLISRASIVVATLVLLSPAQYPWYTIWLAPFLAFRPYRAFLLLTATMPLCYTSFYLAAREAHEVYTSYIVWIIWLPVWSVITWGGIGAICERLRYPSPRVTDSLPR